MEISLYPAYNVISKMIYPDKELRKDIMCIGGTSQWPATLFRGIDQWGEKYGYLLVDPIGGAIGAFTMADGINTGGQARTPICQLPNIEHTEQNFPILFLYRKELSDSGGAGKYRGGLSAESCFIPHNTESVTQDTLSSGNAIPTSPGLMGGYPSTTNGYTFIRDSNIDYCMKNSTMPSDTADLTGCHETLQLRQENFTQRPNDVYAVRWSGGGGFGDPFERDLVDIENDLDTFAISAEAARSIYGVVILEDGSIDAAATALQRGLVKQKRMIKATKAEKRGGTLVYESSATLNIYTDATGDYWCCAKCQQPLGDANKNYKTQCTQENRDISASNPLIGDPSRFVDDAVEFRQFYCTGCGSLIDNEIAVASDIIMHDVRKL
jgi:N-methylhydantoinase B